MKMITYKITLKLVRSFSVGFTIFSPKLNGLCISFDFLCFSLMFRNRGTKLFAIENYWNGWDK